MLLLEGHASRLVWPTDAIAGSVTPCVSLDPGRGGLHIAAGDAVAGVHGQRGLKCERPL